MPKFRVEWEDGKAYTVEAPTAEDAYATVEEMHATPAPPPEGRSGGGLFDKIDAGVRGAADMLTFGLADEGAALAGSLVGDETYDQALSRERAVDRYDEQENPYARLTGQLAGGVAGGVGAGRLVGPALSGISRATALGTGATGGAAWGGAYGFGSGEGGAANRLESSVPPAVMGAGAGLAAPVVASGIGNLMRHVAGTRAAQSALKPEGLSGKSGALLSRLIRNDDVTDDALSSLSRSSDGMMVDVTPSGGQALDMFFQRGGPGVNRARQAIEARAARANQTVNDALDSAFGKPTGMQSLIRGIRNASQPARSAAYESAYSKAIDYSSDAGREIERLLSFVPRRAIAEANELQKLDEALGIVRARQILADVADDGSVTFRELPNVQQIDYLKRALDSVARQTDTQGAMGGQTPMGMRLEQLSARLRDLTTELVPEYRGALDVASDAISEVNAVKLGQKLLSRNVTREEAANEIARLSGPAQLQALRQGIRAQIDEVLANVRRTVQDPNVDARQAIQAIKDMSSKAAHEKLTAILGPDEASRLLGAMDEAAKALDLRGSMARNAATFGRLAGNEALNEAAAPGLGRTFIEAGDAGGLQEGVKRILREFIAAPRSQQVKDRIVQEVTTALTEPRGPDAARLVRILQSSGMTTARAEEATRALLAPLSGGITGGGIAASPRRTVPVIDVGRGEYMGQRAVN